MKVRLLVTAVAILSMVTFASATTWTVKQAGGGDYTTIKLAMTNASTVSGDTIEVFAGTYVESLTYAQFKSGVTLIGQQDGSVHWKPDANLDYRNAGKDGIVSLYCNNATIKWFNLESGPTANIEAIFNAGNDNTITENYMLETDSGSWDWPGPIYSGYADPGANLTITNNRVVNGAFYIQNAGTGKIFQGNSFFDPSGTGTIDGSAQTPDGGFGSTGFSQNNFFGDTGVGMYGTTETLTANNNYWDTDGPDIWTDPWTGTVITTTTASSAFPIFTWTPAWVQGDMNDDGLLNNQDVNPFVLWLTDPNSYMAAYPSVDANTRGDYTSDGLCNNQDINGFVTDLTTGGAVPEPATMALIGLGGLALLRRRSR